MYDNILVFFVEQAELVCHVAVKQSHLSRSARVGVKVRSCVWSEDSSWFAYSCGQKMVKIMQWNKVKNCWYQSTYQFTLPKFLQ